MELETWRQILAYSRANGLRLGFPHHGQQFHAWRPSSRMGVPGIYYGDSICGKRTGQSLRDGSVMFEFDVMCKACLALCFTASEV
jgi:hypothetical protein